tara:strand:- start:82 stop:246 length:165 start_codon:yes stop_codon:yes gene_type:complete
VIFGLEAQGTTIFIYYGVVVYIEEEVCATARRPTSKLKFTVEPCSTDAPNVETI